MLSMEFILDKRNFVQPDDWIPERFTTRPELILDKRAFMPWGIGEFAVYLPPDIELET